MRKLGSNKNYSNFCMNNWALIFLGSCNSSEPCETNGTKHLDSQDFIHDQHYNGSIWVRILHISSADCACNYSGPHTFHMMASCLRDKSKSEGDTCHSDINYLITDSEDVTAKSQTKALPY